jgi:uncharacterized protein|nr:MAG: dynein regulation protein LC7 [Actinomycetota bacterium]
MTGLSTAARRFDWLVTEFVRETPGVAHAIVVSSDGLPLAGSDGFPADRADQLAAVAAGLQALTGGAAQVFDGGPVRQTVVEMEAGLLLLTAIADGSCLAVLASRSCDLGLVAYNMTLLSDRAGKALTPALRAELRAARTR